MRAASVLLCCLALGACESLPHDGPSFHAVQDGVKTAKPLYALVDLNYGVTQQIAAHPAAALTGLAKDSSIAPNDLIAEGDTLAVSVFEAGTGSLFSRPMNSTGASGGSEGQQTFPHLVVDRNGTLDIPFAGAVRVAGLTARQASDAIRAALKGKAVDPQVTVSVIDSKANSVAIIGEVRNAGHVQLSAHNDHLLDVLASAGGPTKAPADLMVVVSRGDRFARAPLSVILADPAQNIRLAPLDQIRVLSQTRKFSTFGALGRIAQTPIEDDTLTLADAISRSGGLDSNSAAAAQVMLFRFERPEVAAALGVATPPAPKGVPIIYRLNLRKPDGLFIASNFDIRSDDLLYVPRSDITEAEKFLSVVNTATQIVYNVRVTSVIP